MPARFHPLETREKQSSVASDQHEPGNLPSDFIDRSTTSPSKINLHAKPGFYLPQNQSSLGPKTQHPSSLTPSIHYHHHYITPTEDRDADSVSPLTHIAGKEQNSFPLLHPPPTASDFAPPSFASESRSPPNRRPPASRSSYGIEVSNRKDLETRDGGLQSTGQQEKNNRKPGCFDTWMADVVKPQLGHRPYQRPSAE